MPHPESSILVPFTTTPMRRLTEAGYATAYGSDTMVLQNSGTKRVYYQAASKSNPLQPPDYAWRTPSGYKVYGSVSIAGVVRYIAIRRSNGKRQDISSGFLPTEAVKPVYTTAQLTSIRNELNAKAIKKFRERTALVAVSIAERKKTVAQAGDLIHRTANVVEELIRLKKTLFSLKGRVGLARPGGREIGDRIVDDWLGFQYGIMPLAQDIWGVCAVIEDKVVNKPIRFTGRAQVTRSASTRSLTPQPYPARPYTTSWVGTPNQFEQSSKTKSTFKVRIDAKMQQGSFRTAAQLGLTNPVEWIWELIPYSFVVDWFAGVGDYIGQLAAFEGLQCTGVAYTEHHVVDRKARYFPGSGYCLGPVYQGLQDRWEYYHINEDASSHYEGWERTISMAFPYVPLLFHNPLSLTHFANGMSLLVSAFRQAGNDSRKFLRL